MQIGRTSYEIRTKFVQISHEIRNNHIHGTLWGRISYEIRTNFVRISHEFRTNFVPFLQDTGRRATPTRAMQ